MTQFITYRDGTGPLEGRIKKAVRLFYAARCALPIGIVVNPSEMVQAQAAAEALALSVLPVQSSGGCLLSEIWLEVGPIQAGDHERPDPLEEATR